MDQQYWYYRLNEQQVGPVKKDDIHALLIQQILTADSYVWAEGMENWQPIGQIPDFATWTAGQPPKRPTSVTVLATLNIIFGGLSLLCSPFGIIGLLIPQPNSPFQMGPGMRMYSLVSYAVGFVMAIVLLSSGIGLLNLKRWARETTCVYGWIALIWGILGTVITAVMFTSHLGGASQEEMPMVIGGIIGGMCGGVFGLIYPVLLIIFMRKPSIVQACSR